MHAEREQQCDIRYGASRRREKDDGADDEEDENDPAHVLREKKWNNRVRDLKAAPEKTRP